VSHDIFERERSRTPEIYTYILQTIGRKGDLASKVRESLVSIGGCDFRRQRSRRHALAEGQRAQLKSMQRDVQSLSDHAPTCQQRHLPARRHARRRDHRAEQHHQDFLGRGGGVDAADADRLDLRHEFHGTCRSSNGTSAIRSRSF
jgi:hypothetical protein